MLDRLLLLGLMLVAYGLGFVLLRWTIGLAVVKKSADAGWAGWLPVLLPVGVAILLEGVTGKWHRTPGALGTGPLTVVVPMLIAGAVAAIAVLCLRGLGPASPAGAQNASIVAGLAVAALSISMWWFWPEPRARLF